MKNNFCPAANRFFFAFLISALLGMTWPGIGRTEQTPALKGELLKVEGSADDGRFKVLIKVKNPVQYQSFALAGPARLVINLTPCLKGSGPLPDLNIGPVQRLRGSQFNDDTVRIVLDLRGPVSYNLSAQTGDPFLLVVTFPGERGKKKDPDERKPDKSRISAKKLETGGKGTLAVNREELKKPAGGGQKSETAAGPAGGVDSLKGAEQALKNGDFITAIGLLKKIQAETADKKTWDKTGQPLLQQALARRIGMVFEKGDHREVLRLFGIHQDSLKEGVDPGLLQNVGNSYKALGFYDPAVRYFQAAWQGGGQGSPALVLDWAEALAGQGKPADAASLVQPLLERPAGPGDLQARAVRLRVRCLYQQRLHTEALKALEDAGRRFPKMIQDPEYHYLLGIVCFEIPGMGPKALQSLKQFIAVGQDPAKTAGAYEKIGDLHFGDKQYEEAWRAYAQAVGIQPEAQGTFLSKKLTQCRLLVETRRRGYSAGTGVSEPDPFWQKLQEHRSAQEKLEKKVSDLRLK